MNVLPAYGLHRNGAMGGKRFMKNAMISSCSTNNNPSVYETFLVVSDGGITGNLLSSHFFAYTDPLFLNRSNPGVQLSMRCTPFVKFSANRY